MSYSFDFAYCSITPPTASAVLREQAEDFQVNEILGFQPTGQGEHVLLQVRKRHANTHWIAKQLAKFCQVPTGHVSYAGLKDRHAETTQWFSVHLAGKPDLAWDTFSDPEAEILQTTRHNRKLKQGAAIGNQFVITLRDVVGDKNDIEQRLQQIKTDGVPNYFGEQRFGINGQNVSNAAALFAGTLTPAPDRQVRGLYLSAARSYLFNHLLAERIKRGCWNQAIDGDVVQPSHSHTAVFSVETVDTELQQRIARFEAHPAAPLYGTGKRLTQLAAATLEDDVFGRFPDFCQGLQQAELQQDFRPLRVIAEQLTWQWLTEEILQVSFQLRSGAFATTVLREIVNMQTQTNYSES